MSWSISKIGDEMYFIKVIALGKYMVGTVSCLSQYDILESYSEWVLSRPAIWR